MVVINFLSPSELHYNIFTLGLTIEKPGVGVTLSVIGGNLAASKKFITAITKLLGDKPVQPNNEPQQNNAINLVLDLLVENKLIDKVTAARLALSVGKHFRW